jgi:CHASE1-domain containing sensor protein
VLTLLEPVQQKMLQSAPWAWQLHYQLHQPIMLNVSHIVKLAAVTGKNIVA